MSGASVLPPIEDLCLSLDYEFENGGDGARIREIMQEYVEKHSDWRQYAKFCPHKYSRNLINRTPEYEIMVICWGEGQVSPIHNHEGQRCWMGVVEGEIEETYFMFKDTKCTKGSGPLEVMGSAHPIDMGTVGYITDEVALHVIRPTTKSAVSIHLYSKPIPECNIYCPKTGLVTRRKLGYYSEYKKICEPSQQAPSCTALPSSLPAAVY
eukprot:TRINITY_DN2171_c0_g1_i1.p1 TRINITY_DN2171_c0_g1~~TRINITY_DN2171_c0_g1_i1.p1  ORF type:complete len:231 (-),score=43.60 TRINITY_DN2171_c0_g1_i1:83-712(-)